MSMHDGAGDTFHLDITIDHSQMFLEDCEWVANPEDVSTLYDEEARARHLGISQGQLSIYTARSYGSMRVQVMVCNHPPDDNFAKWDHVAEASLGISTQIIAGVRKSFTEEPYLSESLSHPASTPTRFRTDRRMYAYV